MQQSRKKEKPLANVIFVDLLDPRRGLPEAQTQARQGHPVKVPAQDLRPLLPRS